MIIRLPAAKRPQSIYHSDWRKRFVFIGFRRLEGECATIVFCRMLESRMSQTKRGRIWRRIGSDADHSSSRISLEVA